MPRLHIGLGFTGLSRRRFREHPRCIECFPHSVTLYVYIYIYMYIYICIYIYTYVYMYVYVYI